MEAPDYEALKIEYLSGTESLKEVCDRFGANYSYVRKISARNNWAQERNKISHKVEQVVADSIVDKKAEMLKKFNADDVKIAEALKAKAAKLLNTEDPDEKLLLRLTKIFDGAQKIGRLALGASTENTDATITTSEAKTLDDFYKDIERQEEKGA